jgi:hypothetical protein
MAYSHRSHGGLLGIFRQIFCSLARKYCPPEKPPRRPKDRVVFFAPGQLSVLVEHTNRLSDVEIAELTRATSFLQDRRLGNPIYIPPERVVTFQRGPQDFFSVVFVEAPALYNDAVTLLRTVISFNRILQRQEGEKTNTPPPPPNGYQSDQAQTSASERATTDQGQASAPPPATLIVRRFSPNWTAGGSSQGIGGGGPGARPVLPATPISVAPATPSPWDITIKNLSLAQTPDQWGAGVEVAILDTMPAQIDIDAAYLKWNMSSPTLAPNPLIDRLFRPGGPLRLSPGGYSHLLNLASFHVAGAPYVMVDHGTFIAGIINTIAPQATIHLIEVLNPLGVGTLETIVRGFKRLVDDRSVEGVIADSPPLVVNASLVLCLPSPTLLAQLAAAPPDQEAQDQASQELALAGIDASTLEATNAALQAICDLLQPHNVYFVAAAGNDNTATLPNRPEADYPAALTNVLGVGALDRMNQPTDYSNMSDRPPTDGLATFGGIRAANGQDTDNVDGVLGIYTSEFPTPLAGPPGSQPPNIQGWARWAGTSFAAPMISGGIAAVISDSLAQGLPPPSAPDQTLRNIDPTLSSAIGKVVEMQQG